MIKSYSASWILLCVDLLHFIIATATPDFLLPLDVCVYLLSVVWYLRGF